MKEFSEKEFLLLAYLEGDLGESDIKKVEAMLAEDAALMDEYRLLTKAVLPVEEVSYANKALLKKDIAPQKVSLGYLVWTGAVAAVLAVLILFYSPTIIPPSSNVVKVEENSTPEIVTPKLNIDKDAALAEVSPKVNEVPATKKNKTVKIKGNPPVKEYVAKTAATKEIDVVLFEKQELNNTPLLAVKEANIPVETTSTEVKINTDLSMPQYTLTVSPDENYENKGWFARTTYQINSKLNTWVSYLQKPKVEIGKKEPIGGRIYWAISVEADKYEWEGRLYTRR